MQSLLRNEKSCFECGVMEALAVKTAMEKTRQTVRSIGYKQMGEDIH